MSTTTEISCTLPMQATPAAHFLYVNMLVSYLMPLFGFEELSLAFLGGGSVSIPVSKMLLFVWPGPYHFYFQLYYKKVTNTKHCMFVFTFGGQLFSKEYS